MQHHRYHYLALSPSGTHANPAPHLFVWRRGSGSGCDARRLSTGRSIRAWRTLCGRQMTRNAGRGWRSHPGPTYLRPPKTAENRRDVGRADLKTPGLNSRPYWPGASLDAGRSRVSLRRSVQAVSGFVIRQRPRASSRAVIPSPRLSARRCLRTRPCGRCVIGTMPHPTSKQPS